MVSELERRPNRVPLIMHLLRALHFLAAYFSFTWKSVQNSRNANTIANAESRNRAERALSLCSQLKSTPSPVSPEVPGLVMSPEIE